jgi:hypothetical protein
LVTASANFGYTSPIIGYVPTIIILVLYAISEANDVMETRARHTDQTRQRRIQWRKMS